MTLSPAELLASPEVALPDSSPRRLAASFAALSHPARVEILQHLARRESCCCGDVVEKFDLAQSTVSQHLKVLVEAGLVRFEPDRRRSRYCIDRDALSGLSDSVANLVNSCCR